MAKSGEEWRPDFESAMGEIFGEFIRPSMPLADTSPHECCEVIWSVAGMSVTPRSLAALTDAQVLALSEKFGEYFESQSPSVDKIKKAIAKTLIAWPVGSLDE